MNSKVKRSKKVLKKNVYSKKDIQLLWKRVAEENSSEESSSNDNDDDSSYHPSEEECVTCNQLHTTGKICSSLKCSSFKHFFCRDCYRMHDIDHRAKMLTKLEDSAMRKTVEKPESTKNGSGNQHEKTKLKGKRLGHSLKAKRMLIRTEKKITCLLTQHLGSKDAVTEHRYLKKRSYVYKCPSCTKYISDKLVRHLKQCHKMHWKEAQLTQSKMRILYLWCCGNKHNRHLPLPCEDCGYWYSRLDNHLKTHKIHEKLNDDEKIAIIEVMKEKHWSKDESTIPNHSKSTLSNPTHLNEEQQPKFIKRAPNINRTKEISKHACNTPKDIGYIPAGSTRISEDQMNAWNLSEDDFFTIYFETSTELLEYFQSNMEGNGHEHSNATQHRNQVELIWSTLDEEMNMFPKNSFANIHLFRDFYHVPNRENVGKLNCVQASTMRARYVSLNFFFQFLRKMQIFAGITRRQMTIIETAVEDFNKELNPLIKQRKVDVREEKRKNLLSANHFIRYGRSNHVQRMIKSCQSSTKNFTKTFAVKFRDYLITNVVIGNGLRASNVIELNVNDFLEATDCEQYPGQKVVTNQKYKTSTIYGEKFVVISNVVHGQVLFYIKSLRPLVSMNCSNKVFLPSNDESKKMSQTNVSSSLTASFKDSGVLAKEQNQRVSCTRIRCALATFACNDGGYDTAFFAEHFMKNKEETTSIHYNLLSNRRHALEIAMKLYNSFSAIGGSEIQVSNQESDLLVKQLTANSKNLNKGNVLDWLKKRDPTLSKFELEEFTNALEYCSPSYFYSKHDKLPISFTDGVSSSVAEDSTSRVTKDIHSSVVKINSSRVTEDSSSRVIENVLSSVVEDGSPGVAKDSSSCVAEDVLASVDEDRSSLVAKERGLKDVKNHNIEGTNHEENFISYATPKRQKGFDIKEVVTIRNKCHHLLFEQKATDDGVKEALEGTDILIKYTVPKIRARLAYERRMIEKKKKSKNKVAQKIPPIKKKKKHTKFIVEDDSSDTAESESSTTSSEHDCESIPPTPPRKQTSTFEDSKFREVQATTNEPLKTDKVEKTQNISVAKMAPSKVIEHCNERFKKDQTRALRKRSRQNQFEKAKEYCLGKSDEDGFEKLFIRQHIDGYGIFATQDFSKGDYLLTYKGPLLEATEGVKLEETYSQGDSFGNFMYYFENWTSGHKQELCIDATHTDGLCKYVNDSAHGNCKMKKVDVCDKPYLCLFAATDISCGTELRYDYGETSQKLWWRKKAGCTQPFQKEMLAIEVDEDASDDVIPPTPTKKAKKQSEADFCIDQTSYMIGRDKHVEIH